MKNIEKIIFLAITFLVFSFIFTQTVFAIGQVTQPIVINDVLRGQEVTITLTLLNSEEKEVVYGLRSDGQVADWATFFNTEDENFENPITQVNMPSGEYVRINVKMKVPEDTPNGEYTGKLFAFLDSGDKVETEDASVSVAQEIGRDITINVTDKEIFNLSVTFIPKSYDVKKGNPLEIRVLYNNKGNVSVKPDLQLKITKNGVTKYNVIIPYPDSEEAVRGFSKKEIPAIEWQTTGQEKGKYKAELKVFLNGEEIQKKSFKFSIGSFHGSVWVSAISFFGGGNLGIGWVVLGVILLVIAVSFGFLEKRGTGLVKVFGSIRRLF